VDELRGTLIALTLNILSGLHPLLVSLSPLIMTFNCSPLSFQHVMSELRLYCGEESLAALSRELKRGGFERAVLVCGRSVSSSYAMELLRGALGTVLAGECRVVRSNSPLPAVEETAHALHELKADAVIAVGGGSAAVTARAAAILFAEKRPAQELCTRRLPNGNFESPRLVAPKLPQFVVATTPSTAFVKAGSAIHDTQTGQRLALFDPKTRAKAIFLHPEFLRSSPSSLVQSATLNTLSTAVEALESPKCDPISEAMLMHSLRLIGQHLDRISSDDIMAREMLAIAAMLCGRGTEQVGGGLASALAHAIGHRTSVANGIVNAIVLPHTMRFNASTTLHSAARIATSLQEASMAGAFVQDPPQTVELLEALLRKLAIPRRLRDIGLVQSDLDAITDAAMSDWFISRSAQPVSRMEVRAILNAAW
jgi:alcohol dehydrogenase class IV